MRRELTLENLKLHKNGRRIHAAWHHDLQRLVADCQDRPADDRTRELHLILRMSPVLDEDGIDCEDVHLDFEVKAKVPSRQIRGD